MDVGFKPFFVLFKWVMVGMSRDKVREGWLAFHRRCLNTLCKKPVLNGGKSKERRGWEHCPQQWKSVKGREEFVKGLLGSHAI